MIKAIEFTALVSALIFSLCLIGLMFSYGSPSTSSEPPQQQHAAKNEPIKSTSEADKPFWEKATTDPVAAFTLFLVIFTALLSGVGAIQLKLLGRAETVAERSANAAKDAADVAKATLISSQRAWIRIDEIGLGGGGLMLDQNGASVAISFKISNVGNSPATNITLHAWLVALKQDGPIPWQEQKRLCGELREKPFLLGFTLFPAEQFPSSMGYGGFSVGTNVPIEDIKKAAEISADKKHVSLQVFGCVDYTFATDATVHHQTGFIRTLQKVPPQFVIGVEDGLIPIQQLMLMSEAMGLGQYAD